jgi:hypothetical protein
MNTYKRLYEETPTHIQAESWIILCISSFQREGKQEIKLQFQRENVSSAGDHPLPGFSP